MPAPVEDKKTTAVSASNWPVLTRIFDDDVNLAVLERQLPGDVNTFAQALVAQENHLERRVTVQSWSAAGTLIPETSRSLPGHEDFIADLQELLEAYWLLFNPSAVGLRLHVLDRAMCPRFHTDKVPVRLITTYLGQATQWLDEASVKRSLLDRPLPGGADPHARPERIKALSAGDVGLFKGEAWIGNEGRGIVHRSPACDPRNPRVVVTLDWLDC